MLLEKEEGGLFDSSARVAPTLLAGLNRADGHLDHLGKPGLAHAELAPYRLQIDMPS